MATSVNHFGKSKIIYVPADAPRRFFFPEDYFSDEDTLAREARKDYLEEEAFWMGRC